MANGLQKESDRSWLSCYHNDSRWALRGQKMPFLCIFSIQNWVWKFSSRCMCEKLAKCNKSSISVIFKTFGKCVWPEILQKTVPRCAENTHFLAALSWCKRSQKLLQWRKGLKMTLCVSIFHGFHNQSMASMIDDYNWKRGIRCVVCVS